MTGAAFFHGKSERAYAAAPKPGLGVDDPEERSAPELLAPWDELLKIDGETAPLATEMEVSTQDVKKFLGIRPEPAGVTRTAASTA